MELSKELVQYRKYLVEYNHEGAQWSITLYATSFEDAAERLRKIYYGRVLGTVEAEIPAAMGRWIPSIVCWVKNVFRHEPN
jgi:hypothetical protein